MSCDALFISLFIASAAVLVLLTAIGRIDFSTSYVLAVALFGVAVLLAVVLDVDLPRWVSRGGVLNSAKAVPCAAAALAVGVWFVAGARRR